MGKRLASLTAVTGTVGVLSALLLAGGAGAATTSALPTLTLSLTGPKAVSVSASTVPSGAVKVVMTFKGKLPRGAQGPSGGIVRLNPGVTIAQAAGAVNAHHGDLNALTPFGTLLVDATAPGTVQTVLRPGNYVALNDTSQNGTPGFAPFTVTRSAAPARLPSAAATETAIDFGFRGPRVLHDGTIVRVRNGGFLVHMIVMIGVRDARTGRRVEALLRAGKDRRAQRLSNRRFVSLLLPASPGALQQQVLHARPGHYVEVCFMDTQDGREHTRLGMERLVRVVR